MTLLDAPKYDGARDRKKRNVGISIAIAVVILGALTFWLRNWPAEHRVDTFFQAVEAKDMVKAYGIWNHDPNWTAHPQQYSSYTYGAFQVDWSESSDWGVITSHKVVMAKRTGSGTVIGVMINGRKTPMFLWVESKTKQLGFSPIELAY